MRRIVSLLVVGCLSRPVTAFQVSAGAGGAALKACSLLTKDLVLPFAQNPKVLDFIPPEEESMPNGGAACEYGIVRLQVSPGRGPNRTAPSPEWQRVSGTGEAAFFRANGREYAELMFWTAQHYLTLQVGVPTGSTPDALRPKVLTLANQLMAKLR